MTYRATYHPDSWASESIGWTTKLEGPRPEAAAISVVVPAPRELYHGVDNSGTSFDAVVEAASHVLKAAGTELLTVEGPTYSVPPTRLNRYFGLWRRPQFKNDEWRVHGAERRFECDEGDRYVGLAAVRPGQRCLSDAVRGGWGWAYSTHLITGIAGDESDESLLAALCDEVHGPICGGGNRPQVSDSFTIDARVAAFCCRHDRMYLRPWLHAEPDLYLDVVGPPALIEAVRERIPTPS